MKRTILFAGFISACFIAAIGVVINNQKSSAHQDDIAVKNMEALTDGESSGNIVDCFSRFNRYYGKSDYDCGPCVRVYDQEGYDSRRSCHYSN